MRQLNTIALLLIYCVLAGCIGNDPNLSFSAHSETPIPQSAKLIHCGGQYAGFDASYGFLFTVSDDALLEQLVREWRLEPGQESGGFFSLAKHSWWPTEEELSKIDTCFTRTDDQKEEYWSVWVDRASGKLYAEHGWW